MSVEAMNWSFKLPLKDMAAKAALHALGNHADTKGRSWPSIARIAWYAGCDEKTARRAVHRLLEWGAIREVASENGATRVYELNFDWSPPEDVFYPYQKWEGGKEKVEKAKKVTVGDGASHTGRVASPTVGAESSVEPSITIKTNLLDGLDPPKPAPPPPVDQAIQAYNEVAKRTGWPTAAKLTPKRRTGLKARLEDAGGLVGWTVLLERASRSSFLTGKTGGGNGHENWRMDLDFLLRDEKFTRLREGAYDDRKAPRQTGFQI